MPYQQAVIREALRTDAGLFVYSFILWSDIKKSAKSTIAGAISLYLAWFHAWESVRVVANDLKQADSRTFFYIERAIKLHPILRKACKTKNYHIDLPNHTTIDAIPVDPKGEAGGGDLCTAFTEMWAMKNRASQQLWSETTLSPLKFGKSLRIGESYAGMEGDSVILHPLYTNNVKPEYRIDLSYRDSEGVYHDFSDLEVYRNDRTLTLWNTIPRCPWQKGEVGTAYYKQESDVLTPSEFNRMHRNQWATSSDAFVPIAWWDACKVGKLAEMRPRQGMVLGIDAAVNSDWFAIVGVVVVNGHYQVRYCNVWKPKDGQKINLSEPAAEIERLRSIYNIECVAYDPMHMEYMAQMLGDNLFWYRVEQGKHRLICDKYLYDAIREQLIEHDGSYPIIREALINADKKPEDDKLRIIKRSATGHIDPVIALSMAVERASAYNI